jgi:hypothetical protein
MMTLYYPAYSKGVRIIVLRFAMELVGCYDSQCFAVPSILRFVQSVQWFAQSLRWFAQSVRLFAQSGPAFCTVGVLVCTVNAIWWVWICQHP